jgi:hypothetical protein
MAETMTRQGSRFHALPELPKFGAVAVARETCELELASAHLREQPAPIEDVGRPNSAMSLIADEPNLDG